MASPPNSSSGLEANNDAAAGLSNQPVETPCGSCPKHYLAIQAAYKPSLDGVSYMSTYKDHTVTGPETRNTQDPFTGYKRYDPIAAGTYKLKFNFTRQDLRFFDFNFTQIMTSADR